MAKETFNIDFRSGSLREKHSNALGVNVGNKITRQEKGLAYAARQSNSGQITYPAADMTALNFGTGAFSVACAFKMGEFINIGSTRNVLFSNGIISTNAGIAMDYASAQELRLLWEDGSGDNDNILLNDFGSLYDGKYHLVILTFDGTTYKGFLDNTKETIESTTIKTITSAQDFYVCRDGGIDRRSNSDIAYIRAYDTALTQSERNDLYTEFLHSYGTTEQKRNFTYPKPTDLSSEVDSGFTGDEYTKVMEFTDNAADTSSLKLNDTGDFAVVDWTGNSDFQEISTTAETTSSVVPSTVKIFAKNSVLTYFYSTNNNFSFDLASLPIGLTYYYNCGSNTTSGDLASLPTGLTNYTNTGSNTTSGDIASLPTGLTSYYNTGSNTTSGDIASLPTGLTSYYNTGSNTTSGDIASLPTGLTTYINYGSNTTSGDIASLPTGLTYYTNCGLNTTSGDIASLPTELTYYYNYGSNTTSGDIASLPTGLTYYRNQGSNQVDTYTSGHTFDSGIIYFLNLPAAGYGLSSTEVNNLLIDLDASGMSSGTIDLSGNNTAPGASGETAIDALRVKGISVTVTGGY